MEDNRCKDHPDAPHGFMRDASHSAGRYVCECESWEPKQEPVAWMHVQGNYEEPSFRQLFDDEVERGWGQYPLYTAPPKREWVGLTDAEIHDMNGYEEDRRMYRFARDVEAKLKEKNT